MSVPTNREMSDLIFEVTKRELTELMEMGCCGDRRCDGECNRTKLRCRVVGRAIEVLRSARRFRER